MRSVLIETLWNVKTEMDIRSTQQKLVLIETLWNVKKPRRSVRRKHTLRINRNIVECKGTRNRCSGTENGVLIETLWNVKWYKFFLFSVSGIVLIETLWNVKYFPSLSLIFWFLVLIETLWNVKLFMRVFRLYLWLY